MSSRLALGLPDAVSAGASGTAAFVSAPGATVVAIVVWALSSLTRRES